MTLVGADPVVAVLAAFAADCGAAGRAAGDAKKRRSFAADPRSPSAAMPPKRCELYLRIGAHARVSALGEHAAC
jgi:hypothetical protein